MLDIIRKNAQKILVCNAPCAFCESNIDNLLKNKKNTKDVILNKDELIKLNFNLIEMINYIIGLSNILIMIIMLIMISI